MAFLTFDIISIQRFLPFDIMSHLAFLTFNIISCRHFFPFDLMSYSAFFYLRSYVLLLFCPIRCFVLSTFLTIQHFSRRTFVPFDVFVRRRFLPSAFFTSTFFRWTIFSGWFLFSTAPVELFGWNFSHLATLIIASCRGRGAQLGLETRAPQSFSKKAVCLSLPNQI